MKIITTIAYLFIITLSFGQEVPSRNLNEFKRLVLGEYNYNYTTANSDHFFEEAKNLIKIKNPDSSYKASKIMYGLFLFNDTKYSLDTFQPLLSAINISNRQIFEQSLIGSWRFSHDFGTGLVTQISTSTAVDTGNVVNFDGCEASFFFNDSLTRKTHYSLNPVKIISNL